jgi:hypothetical protein
VVAGNCKLGTLRQYYCLPEHGSHMVPGDVGIVADLFATVLRSIAEQRGRETWEQLAAAPARKGFGPASPSGSTMAGPSRKTRTVLCGRLPNGMGRRRMVLPWTL